ncbi:amino acid ABC transporter substrate-binding protein [Synergistales bacterium]|nr:amino acid ABC transporter substrate-binding protein [Synergistales bacterium]
MKRTLGNSSNIFRGLAILSVLLLAAAVFTAHSASAAEKDSLAAIKAAGKIRIGVYADEPPFGYIDNKGKNAGFDLVIARRVAKDLLGGENKVEWVPLNPADRVEYLETNKVDIVFANFTVTKERAERVDFALPYMKAALGLVSKNGQVIKDIAELKGKKLIIVKGSTAEKYLAYNYPDVELLKFEDMSEALQALTGGRGAALSNDNTLLFAWANANPGYTVGIPSFGSPDTIAPAVRKGNKELLRWLNDELKKLGGERFMHKAYKEALEPFYGGAVDPESVVVEGGVVK